MIAKFKTKLVAVLRGSTGVTTLIDSLTVGGTSYAAVFVADVPRLKLDRQITVKVIEGRSSPAGGTSSKGLNAQSIEVQAHIWVREKATDTKSNEEQAADIRDAVYVALNQKSGPTGNLTDDTTGIITYEFDKRSAVGTVDPDDPKTYHYVMVFDGIINNE
jgi:hypothetical protein